MCRSFFVRTKTKKGTRFSLCSNSFFEFRLFRARPHLVYLLQRDEKSRIVNLPPIPPLAADFLHYVLVEDPERRPSCAMALAVNSFF